MAPRGQHDGKVVMPAVSAGKVSLCFVPANMRDSEAVMYARHAELLP